jgi:hypothetical protein
MVFSSGKYSSKWSEILGDIRSSSSIPNIHCSNLQAMHIWIRNDDAFLYSLELGCSFSFVRVNCLLLLFSNCTSAVISLQRHTLIRFLNQQDGEWQTLMECVLQIHLFLNSSISEEPFSIFSISFWVLSLSSGWTKCRKGCFNNSASDILMF